ncbi:acyltransferase [Pseudodesulfovibrio cashew]|uniref:acyltransferase n=1 Tax=Pseudodesulfovibrio cashew TaxID=2678688 RepID=UPI00131CE2DA|nr:acyltransferase family protein [Pseudodesulfovibrio cashew]
MRTFEADPVRDDSLVWTESARALAILAVVLQHSTEPLLTTLPTSAVSWVSAVAVNSATRWAAPLFIMVSGALLLRPEYAQGGAFEFYKRRAARVASFLFWIAAYAIVLVLSGRLSAGLAWKGIVDGTLYYHLWFLYAITGLYAVTPLLRLVRGSVSAPAWRSLTLLAILIAVVYAVCLKFWWVSSSGGPVLFLPYVGYYMAGSVLSGLARGTISRGILCGGLLLCVTASAVGVVVFTDLYGNLYFGRYFHGNFSPPVVLGTFCVFQLLREMDWHSELLSALSRASFAIYILHPVPLVCLAWAFGTARSITGALLFAVSAFCLTALMAKCFYANRVFRRVA